MVFPSNNSSSKVVEPADRAFHDPPTFVSTELPFVRHWTVLAILSRRTDEVDSLLLHAVTQRVTVTCFVINQPFRMVLSHQSVVHKTLDQPHFIDIGRFAVDRQRDPVCIDKKLDLGRLAATSWPNLFAPFFVDENVPSPNVSEQSIFPCSSSISRSCRCTCSMIPCSVIL